jgi:shikimate dehydrogenase
MNEVYPAADLINGGEKFRALDPPARLAVFGNPIEQSKSPLFQNAALRASGMDAQYVRVHVQPSELDASLKALPGAGFLGINLTYPHKTAALASIDALDPAARVIGAVNTISLDEGRLTGFNTDGSGFIRAIREEFSVDVRDLRVMVLGAGGGAGRAIAVQCALEGCERLVLVNRSVEKAAALASELAPYFRSDRLIGPADRLSAIPHESAALRTELAQIDLVVNATTIGMKRSDPPILPQTYLTPNLMVYDAVYAGGKTRLVEDAEQAGARAANGLSMLLHQGALAFEIWFNRPAPLAAMRAALQAA